MHIVVKLIHGVPEVVIDSIGQFLICRVPLIRLGRVACRCSKLGNVARGQRLLRDGIYMERAIPAADSSSSGGVVHSACERAPRSPRIPLDRPHSVQTMRIFACPERAVATASTPNPMIDWRLTRAVVIIEPVPMLLQIFISVDKLVEVGGVTQDLEIQVLRPGEEGWVVGMLDPQWVCRRDHAWRHRSF